MRIVGRPIRSSPQKKLQKLHAAVSPREGGDQLNWRWSRLTVVLLHRHTLKGPTNDSQPHAHSPLGGPVLRRPTRSRSTGPRSATPATPDDTTPATAASITPTASASTKSPTRSTRSSSTRSTDGHFGGRCHASTRWLSTTREHGEQLRWHRQLSVKRDAMAPRLRSPVGLA